MTLIWIFLIAAIIGIFMLEDEIKYLKADIDWLQRQIDDLNNDKMDKI